MQKSFKKIKFSQKKTEESNLQLQFSQEITTHLAVRLKDTLASS